MRYVLDTNTCITYLRGRNPLLRQRVSAVSEADIVVPAPVRAELYYGAARSQDPRTARSGVDVFLARFASLPFDDAAAETYGRIRADLESRGEVIGPNDLLIAAIAVARGLMVVTHNTREFGRVGALTIEDWEIGISPGP